jgi:MFS superfamily sulfate permease-like transporter
MVANFNAAVESQQLVEGLRTEGNQSITALGGTDADFCHRCHPPRSVADLRTQGIHDPGTLEERSLVLHHMAGLLDPHLDDLKTVVASHRAALRDLSFVRLRGDGAEPVFVPRDQIPEGATGDGRRWRLRVRNGRLDPDALTLSGGGAVVGVIPRGLPAPKAPRLEASIVAKLLPSAIIISILGFMEAISIAKAMAAKTRQRLDPDQELIGQGLANIVGCCFQSYAVSGSFSRSAVNLQAGARTGMSNVFSSLIVVIVLLFLSPGLYHLPQAVLAAIIMMAVAGLLNVGGFVHAWRTSRFDGVVSVVTFVGTLALAPHLEWGIFSGVVLSLGGYLYRTMRPHVASLAPDADGTMRDAGRHKLGTCRYIAAVRFVGPLNFASTSYLEDEIMHRVADQPELRCLMISGQGLTEVDASGEESLRGMVDRLTAARIRVVFAGLSDEIQDVLTRSHLLDRIERKNVYATEDRAIAAIYAPAHRDSREQSCPFREIVPRIIEVSPHPDGSLRDSARHRLPQCRHIVALRIDSPLNRASIRYVSEWVLGRVSHRPDLRAVLVVGNSISSIDTEASARLAALVGELHRLNLRVAFSGLNEEVVETLERTEALEVIGRDALHSTQAAAVASVWGPAHRDSDEPGCPFAPLAPRLTELSFHPEGTLRDADVHGLRICRHLAVLRIDGPLPFASSATMAAEFDRWRQSRPDVRHVILVGSALGRLEAHHAEHVAVFVRSIRDQDIHVALAHLPDHLAEVLARTGVADALGIESFFASEPAALAAMWSEAHEASDESPCPLEPLLPQLTELSLHPDGSLRGATQHRLARCRHIAVLRFDGPLDYATIGFFERGIDALLADRSEVGFVLIAGHSLPRIDAIAAEELLRIFDRLRSRGLQVCLSGLKDEVLEALRRPGAERVIDDACVFPTQAAALAAIHEAAHEGSDEVSCPLREPVPLDT